MGYDETLRIVEPKRMALVQILDVLVDRMTVPYLWICRFSAKVLLSPSFGAAVRETVGLSLSITSEKIQLIVRIISFLIYVILQ
jgi:hypothetical protein